MTVQIELGSTLAGFRIERLLGHGAMGAVYLAEDVHLRRKVAVKVLAREFAEDERFRRRFLLESQLAASLEHPHIVPIYAAGEEGELLFLAMRYVEGYDLRELIDATDRVGDERAIALLAQVADALDTAHGLGLVHRDVKPANILIGAGGAEHAYLCDFGLARHASTAASLTSERGFAGTIAYVAPEQVESGVVDARADVYSLGCVLFECLTGAPPFERGGDLQVVFAHLKEPPPLVSSRRPDVPEALDDVLQKALAKAPDDRFSTCAELIAEAGEALRLAPPPVERTSRRTIAGVRTFLITDIRGYTSYTAEHGDEAAAALASSFADIVRQVVEERDGRLIELRGDEALVVFDSARQALRSAIALQERVSEAELPRGIGIGLDAGEAVPVGEGYRGGALNLAARMCSLAAPGETLATETVLQLARAVDGIHYGERRPERLKGFAKPVTAVEVVPAGRRTSRFDRRRLKRSATRTFRKRGVRLGAVALAAVAAATVGVLVFTGSGAAHAAVAPQSVGFISSSGKIEGQAAVGGSGELGVVGKSLWLANGDDKTFERVDLKTRKLMHPFVSVQNGFGGAAFGFDSLWAVETGARSLLRVNPHYGSFQRIALPVDPAQVDLTAPTGAAVGAGSVWVAAANKVFRVDPGTQRVSKSIDVPQADELEFGDGKLWVISDNTSTLSEIDPKVDAVVRTVKLRDWINGVAVGGGFVWATVIPDDVVWKIDQNGTVDRTFDVGHAPGPVTFFDGAAWVASNGRLSRIDPTSDEVTDYPVIDRPGGLAAGDGVLYVSTGDSPPALSPVADNQVARVSLPEDFVDDIDPAHAWPNQFRSQLEYATGAQLLNYPDAAGRRGTQLVPDVAAALPTVSPDGRTYTFRIRRGFRFSPPHGDEQVTAKTFQYSIERALSKQLGDLTPGMTYLGDVVGAAAFHDGKALHVAGITAPRDDTLRIRLDAPSGDFLARLSMPFFAAVPIGTPIVDGGLTTPIASAGPYYIKEAWGNDILVLERNPNYGGSRPHRLERVEYSLNDSARRAVGGIAAGTADYTADTQQQSTFAPGGPLAEKYARAQAGRPRLVQTPQLGLSYLLFNTARGPFANVRLRRAVNYALDRRALAGTSPMTASDAYLPAALGGTPAGGIYPLSPHLAQARRLARGFRGTVVLLTCTQPDCAATSRIVRANLEPLGMSVTITAVDNPEDAVRAGARYDMVTDRWGLDYPDPGAFLSLYFAPGAFRPPWSPSPVELPAAARRALVRAAAVRPPTRAAAYARVARTLAADTAPLAVFGTPVVPELFSGRLGCVVEQPVTGLADLASLCIK